MKKLIILGALLFVLASVPLVGAADHQHIVVTLSPDTVATITCNQSVWAPSAGIGSQAETIANWGNITNAGTVYVNVSVAATDSAAWTLESAAGHNQFHMNCTAVGGSEIVLDTDGEVFDASITNGEVVDFALGVIMPTSSSVSAAQETTITFTATML
jgi:hypothetical protein